MITHQSIEVFLAVVEQKSISAAARLFHFSQPTISEHLCNLERELGAKLVLRGKGVRQVRLTPAGHAFLPLAQQWMENQKVLEMQIHNFKQTQPHNVLRIAASAGAHQHIVAPIVYKLMRCHPQLNIQLKSVEYRELESAIETFSFDVALLFGQPPVHDCVTVTPIFKEPYYILCPGTTPLKETCVAPQDLDARFEVRYTSRSKNRAFEQWRQQCAHAAEVTSPYFEVSSLSAVHNYLSDPRAWAAVPAGIALADVALKGNELELRKIEPAPPPRVCHALIAQSYVENKVIRDFLACCDEFVKEREYLQLSPYL